MAETLSSPRTQRKRPADFTGINAERLEAEKAEEIKANATRIATINQVAAEEKNEVVNYTDDEYAVEVLPEVEVQEVELNDPYRTVRVNTKIENMTFGRRVQNPGNPELGIPAIMGDIPSYNFEEGVAYRIKKDMADHLHRLGYLAYIGT